jgi:exodeoxyribonuclease-3
MKIATWNINSLRLRIKLLKKLTDIAAPDIICLQETKCPNEHIPLNEITKLGYQHNYFHGEKGYNGVAIISKLPLKNIETKDLGGRPHTRHISAVLPDGTRLHNFYVPAGRDIPDPVVNEHFAHKLQYLEDMISYFDKFKTGEKHIIVGDFNVAPFENDVWSHKQMLKIISHTPVETEKLFRMYKNHGWVDVARHFVPHDEKLYSWWSYRNQDWKKSNRGRRLDHIWVTDPLKKNLVSHQVLRDARDWEHESTGPSDHVPVIAELEF